MRYLALLGLAVLAACGGGESVSPPAPPPPPPPPPPPAPATVTVSVAPDSSFLVAGDTVRLTATPKDAQGAAVAGRTTAWSTSDQTIATVSAVGLVTAVGSGAATISATIDGKVGTAVVKSLRPDTLPGVSTLLAGQAIPARRFVSRSEDYRTDDPVLPGFPRSYNTIGVTLAPNATVGDVNQMLKDLGAEIAAGIPAGSSAVPGFLVLRLPTRTAAELRAVLGPLRQRSVIRVATPDVLLTVATLPKDGKDVDALWGSWEVTPDGANWSQEAIRAPQMWNLNRAVAALKRRTAVGVFDAGFQKVADLTFANNLTPSKKGHYHGNHVAGIIGATFDNAVGVNGLTPFADLNVLAIDTNLELVDGIKAALTAAPDLRVINLSVGYNWYKYKPAIDARSDVAAQEQANNDGALFADFLKGFAATRPLPYLVASAGNDSDVGAAVPARYGSPLANASLVHGAAPVIVVEAVELTAGNEVVGASYSNVGGHLSAPGSDIYSTVLDSRYDFNSGTSMAAPHVTALIAHLLAVDPGIAAPTMTTNPVRDLLVASATPRFNSLAPIIDAYASVIDIDRVRGGNAVIKMLLDIDDGSPDGNIRINPDFTANTNEDIDADSLPGDGRIDMSDFRRFRDWLLQAENFNIKTLDGGNGEPKRDLNGDGKITLGPEEARYARGDFNGDGGISRTLKAPMRGLLLRPVTDLEVLQSQFVDPAYQASDLPGLLDSWDLTVDVTGCLVAGAVSVTVRATSITGAIPLGTRVGATLTKQQIFTIALATGGVEVVAEGVDDLGNAIGGSRVQVSGQLGSDERFEPLCSEPIILTSALAAGTINKPYSQSLSGGGGTAPITWSIVSGSLPAGLQLSGSSGLISGTPTVAGTSTFTVRATAGNASAQKALSITIAPPSLAITTPNTLPRPEAGLPYEMQLAATGGNGSFTWALVSGTLPAGLTLSGAGKITGTPTVEVTVSVTIQVTSGGASVSKAFVITVLLPMYDGRLTKPSGDVDARLMVVPRPNGKFCFALMFDDRTLPPGGCNFGSADFGAWEGTISGSTITGVTNPGNKPMNGTMTARTVTLTGKDPLGNTLSFTGTR